VKVAKKNRHIQAGVV